jgi:hypothetical protein
MVTLQQVEELRRYANITFNEAKDALEETNGDILEAIINLEKKGRIKAPKDGGYYSSKDSYQDNQSNDDAGNVQQEIYDESGSSFSETWNNFISFIKKLFKKGNRNNFEVIKDGKVIMSIPVTILVVLIIFAFWITIPIMIIGLFLGYKYAFSGPELGKDTVNCAMDSVSSAAENLKKEFKGDNTNGKNSNN